MNASFAILLAVFCALGFSACASSFPKKTKATDPEPPQVERAKLVGRIASIPADKRFVLIQSYGKWNLGSGQILTTHGPDERSANLRTTGESLGEFAAADLQSGLVEIGDAVYSQPLIKPTPAPASAESLPTAETRILKNN